MHFSAGYILACCLVVSQQAEIEISYRASSKIYNPVPAELDLTLVAAFTRHGKRVQEKVNATLLALTIPGKLT